MMKKAESFKHQDAKDYYGFGYQESEAPRKKTGKHADHIDEDQHCGVVAECYIGLSKLLNDEMKAFDIKDSLFLDTLKAQGAAGGNARERLGSGNIYDRLPSTPSKTPNDQEIMQGALLATRKCKAFQEKLWYCGRCVGEVTGRISFINLPIL